MGARNNKAGPVLSYAHITYKQATCLLIALYDPFWMDVCENDITFFRTEVTKLRFVKHWLVMCVC